MSNKVGKCCGLLAVALMLLAASVTHANGQQAVELLDQICAGKKVDLATVSQVRPLIEQLRSEPRPAACSETAANSILELENVLSKANVCSKEATDEIGRYQLKYVYEKSEFSNELPAAIRSFFLAYGFRASKLCKESFLSSLNEVTERHISQNDRKIITSWTDEKNDWVLSIADKDMNLDNLFLVLDYSTFVGSAGQTTERQAVRAPRRIKVLHDELQSRCLNKFKPIYEQLIVPIVRLSVLGFSYEEKSLQKRMDSLKLQESYKYWYQTMVLCESMLNVNVIATETLAKKGGSPITLEVNVYDNEVAEIKQAAGFVQEHQAASAISFEKSVTIQPNDVLIDSNDSYIRKSVKKFNAKYKDTERLQKRALKHTLKLISAQVKSGKIGLGMSKEKLKEAFEKSSYAKLFQKSAAKDSGHSMVRVKRSLFGKGRRNIWRSSGFKQFIVFCIGVGALGAIITAAIFISPLMPAFLATIMAVIVSMLAAVILVITLTKMSSIGKK